MGRDKITLVKSIDNKSVNHPLDKLLEWRGLSIIDLCRMVQMSYKNYERIKLNYVHYLTFRKLHLICGALGLEPHQLVYILSRNRELTVKDKKQLNDSLDDIKDFV
eukprot:GHVU01214818.1.p1 GENE.GHVU01214818.1~~GHVU01214818.1.p1  ORF type:complete len:106 (+),score=7.78 GHVU01214818.1:85-402(+)